MSNTSANNKRLAKNTMMLYIRMLFTLGVSLYTSRVILSVLGVSDYGIYNVVGGVVAMLAFMNNALSGATSRFLTYELGRKDQTKLNQTFSTAFSIHILLAILMLLILETAGFWFVSNKLTIPDGRMDAAIFVYHFSVLACLVQIIQLPFNASIISHERMDAFAYISIFDVVMKLVIVYLLQVGDSDKLQLYGVLVFAVSILTSLLYMGYARRKFEECRIKFSINREIVSPILSFSGWDLYGNLSVVFRGQGLNILQNMFFGPVVNAATGISNQILTAIMGFAENFLVAVKPQIIKYYAAKEMKKFINLMISSSKYCTLLLFLISFPILIEAKFILSIWLVEVPDYAVIFCQLAIINNWISILFRPIVFGIHATGNAKRISIINGTIYLSVLPISYILLKIGGSPIVPFVLNIVLLLVGHLFFTLPTCKRYIPEFSAINFLVKSALICVTIGVLSCALPLAIHISMDEGWTRFIASSFISVLISSILILYVGVDKIDREKIFSFIRNKISRK